ncbi:MAG TPA: MBL fold metallo-hydrolase, partial [Chitinophagaceae bacterium]|nr:MBL fold metallo-hydrolase [Chitinophagaceae bacterium]
YFAAEREELKTGIEKTGLTPILLLNTHCHLDHVFGNKFVHETWNLPLHIHPNEKQVLDFAPQSGQMWQLPFDNYNGPIVYLKEGEKIKLCDDELDVLFVPGHSPGSVAFYVKDAGFVISGDALFRQSIGRTDLPGSNYEVLIESIQTQLYTLADDTKVYSGHGPATTVGYEKRNNPFVKMY